MNFNILVSESSGCAIQALDIFRSCGSVKLENCSRSRLLDIIHSFDVLVVRLGNKIDKEMLFRAANLKAIVSPTTGLNHIDLETAKARQIKIISLKGETEFLNSITATAELTWNLLLTLCRKTHLAMNHVGDGGWNRNLFIGNELKNKTLGIIGFGRLGKIVAEYAKAFRMDILYSDPNVDIGSDGVRKAGLEELLAVSDVITIHVNLSKDTIGLIREEHFNLLKKGAVLINTSRGEILDERALVNALESKRLAGAASDVLCDETSKDPSWLERSSAWKYSKENSNFLITPHIGGATTESMADTEIFIANKLKNYLLSLN